MAEDQPSAWAQARFGSAAAAISQASVRAIHRAHELAMAAHFASTLTSNDAYGSTLYVTQHEQLVEHAQGIPGVAVRKPVDVRSRFEFVVLDTTAVVLYPWRYATDRTVARSGARLRPPVSDLRKSLLALSARPVGRQLTLDQAGIGQESLDAELAEEEAVLEQLARFGRVVTVAYGSNPGVGLFDLGWGDVELVDENAGAVIWHHWERLPGRGEASGAGAWAPTSPIAPLGGADRAGRFDDATLSDDFGLTPRSPLADPPTSEPRPPRPETGTEDSQ